MAYITLYKLILADPDTPCMGLPWCVLVGCTMIDMNSTSGFLGEVSCNTGGGPGQMNRLPPPCFNNLEPTERHRNV